MKGGFGGDVSQYCSRGYLWRSEEKLAPSPSGRGLGRGSARRRTQEEFEPAGPILGHRTNPREDSCMPLDPKRVETVFVSAVECRERAARAALLDRERD
jgi:hypothetical protein